MPEKKPSFIVAANSVKAVVNLLGVIKIVKIYSSFPNFFPAMSESIDECFSNE